MADQIDALFSALSDPTRRAVLAQLAEGPAPIKMLADPHPMALPTFLRHIEILEAAGLVVSRKDGRQRFVALRPQALGPIESWLESQKQLWDGHLARLVAAARRIELQKGAGPARDYSSGV